MHSIERFATGSAVLLIALAALSLPEPIVAADTKPPSSQTCAELVGSKLADTVIESSVWVPAGSVIHNVFPPVATAPQPAHCLVHGEIGHHTGKDGIEYGDRFEVRLPEQWNGRLLFQGGGGLDGILVPAVGIVVADPTAGIPTALERGYTVASTDAGHDQTKLKFMGDFGADPQALADYEFESTKKVSRIAQSLIKLLYGRSPDRSMFMGCSEGGREGLIAAQRYPEIFDGIVAGAPAFHLSGAMVAEAWNTQAFAAVAPAGNQGPDLTQALTDADLKLLSEAVLRQCDALDGVRDNLIADPLACHFDPRTLACHAGSTTDCLSAAKVAAIDKVFSGPKNRAGQALYSDWFYDSGVAEPGWRVWMLGNPHMPALNVLIAPAAINGLALGNVPPVLDVFRMNFDEDAKRIQAIAPTLDATATDYSAFSRRSGRLLIYSGVSDPVFSAADLVRYYSTLKDASSYSRLYLIPGMNHCGGGKATDQFDMLSAIERWVETGSAPERIIARGPAFPGRTRPLCPYPSVARYRGNGNRESADNFVCH